MAGKSRPSLRAKTLQNVATSNLSMTDKQCIQNVFEKFDAMSKADVVEVKHRYWKDRYGNKYDNHLYECSVCGKKALYKLSKDELGTTILEQALTLGCPYCLAKMDERTMQNEKSNN